MELGRKYLCAKTSRTESWIGSKIVTGRWLFMFPCRICQSVIEARMTGTNQEHVNCYLLSFVLKVVDIRPWYALCGVRQNTFRKWPQNTWTVITKDYTPASVRFPLRVKLVLIAPVPAYILDKASPFSAQSSRWLDHKAVEWIHSRRTSRRYCSRVLRESISWTKFVRSRLNSE